MRNQQFSRTRAKVVERYLKKYGVDSSRLVIVSRGPTDGESKDRVEFVVEEEEPLGQPVAVPQSQSTPALEVDDAMQF